ncbi:hypothetical protein VSVS12_03854 [Vibrio scophthalmi]|nr:hypothetical protein VSVS12_03854 [Vibrio scophthalmi]
MEKFGFIDGSSHKEQFVCESGQFCLLATILIRPICAEVTGMSNPVCWFEIYVDDVERAKAFYQDVFNAVLEDIETPDGSNIEMWAFGSDMESYGATGTIVKMPGMAAGGNSVIVYFSCEDCLNEEQKVVAAGGKVIQPKMSIGEHGRISLVSDTEGNIIGLHSTQ